VAWAEPNYNNFVKVAVVYADAVILAREDIQLLIWKTTYPSRNNLFAVCSLTGFEEAYMEFFLTTKVLK